MTSRERLKTILDHKEADRVPLDLGAGKCCKMHKGIYKKVLDYFGLKDDIKFVADSDKITQSALACEDLLVKLESDIRQPLPIFQKSAKPSEEWEDETGYFWKNAWGTVFRMPKPEEYYYDMVSAPLEGTFDNEDTKFDFPPAPAIAPEAVEQVAAYHASGYPVIVQHYGEGFLQAGPRIYGYQDWMMMLGTEDKRAIEFMEKLLEVKTQHWDNVANAFGRDGIDVVCESDDLGMQTGPFVSPQLFRKLLKPYHKKLFDFIRSRLNAKIFLHSCGSVVEFLPDLIEIGLDILNPVQLSAAKMDPVFLKREFGRDITFWGGGVDTQQVLSKKTPLEIRDHVRRNIEIFSKDGGFVFATVHNVQSDVPIENFIAMWEAYKEFRNY